MKKKIFLVSLVFLSFSVLSFAQEEKISLNFKDADIKIVLQTLAEKSEINIVSSPQVSGLVSVQLKDVNWQTALDVILKTYNFGYQWVGEDIILVSTLRDLSDRRAREEEVAVKEPLDTKVFFVHYSKAKDVAEPLRSLLTERGRVTIDERTNALIITDTQTKLREIDATIKELDKATHQVYIEAKFVEVDENRLKEIGLDWGTGWSQIPESELTKKISTIYYWSEDDEGYPKLDTYENVIYAAPQNLNGGKSRWSGQILPSEGSGLELLFQKLTGTQFEVALRALEDDGVTNVISNPKIMTVENKEAKILVGKIVPIATYAYSTETGQRVVSGYEDQEVGIRLRVTPKVVKDDIITLKLKPEVREIIDMTGPNDERPVISTREASTEITMKDGETIMIGGLVQDKVIVNVIGIPLLKELPFLGVLFRKETTTKEKIDLVVFITAKIAESY